MPQFRADRVDAAIWEWVRGILSDPAALQFGLEGYQAENEKTSEPLRQRLTVIEKLLTDNREQLARLLDLFLDGDFPKELLVERKKRLETTIHQLEEEHGKLSAEINTESLTQDQIYTLQEFAAQVATGLDNADHDFSIRRNIIEILDITATLTVEDGEQVVYARCVFGQESLRFKDNLSDGVVRRRPPLRRDWTHLVWIEYC